MLLLHRSRDVLPRPALGLTVRSSFWMGCREPCDVLRRLGRLARIWRACYWCLEACLLLVQCPLVPMRNFVEEAQWAVSV